MTKSKTKTTALLSAAIAVVAFAGVTTVVLQSQKAEKSTQAVTTQKPIDDIEIQLKPTGQENSVKVLNPEFKGDNLTFSEKIQTVPDGVDAKSYAISEYLKNIPAVPKTVKVLNCDVKDSIATIDFNSDIMAGYGTEDEQMIINGILKTMGSFPDVKAVRILVDGEPVETLGNIEIQNPQPVLR